MYQFTQFAQANYNCTDASDSSYGAGNFGTCVTSAATETATPSSPTVGAPNTGMLGAFGGGSFSVILAIVVAFAVMSAAAITILRKKKSTK